MTSTDLKLGTCHIPDWAQRLLPHFRLDGPTSAGVSGGRTSAMMHVLTLAAVERWGGDYLPVFANTGKEAEATLLFLRDLEANTGQPILWVEMVPPKPGAPPREAGQRQVTHTTAHRGPRIWEAFLRMLADYRATAKNEGPVAPRSNMRLCTVQMKHRPIHRLARERFGADYTHLVGLRGDEERRVASLLAQSTRACVLRCPLSEAGVTKAMVERFWAEQPFDLQLVEPHGNCSLCFLKDEGDIAELMVEDDEDAQWWLDVQRRYGDFRRGQTSMVTIYAERHWRLDVIRPSVRAYDWPEMPADFVADPTWLASAKDEAECAYQRALIRWEERRLSGEPWAPKPRTGPGLTRTDADWAAYRWRLLVKQEQRLRDLGRAAFSCSCEAATVAGADDDDDRQLTLWGAR